MGGPYFKGRRKHLQRQRKMRNQRKIRQRQRRWAQHEQRIRALLAQLAQEDSA